MSDKKLSELVDGGTVQAGDIGYIVRSGTSYKVAFGTYASATAPTLVDNEIVRADGTAGNIQGTGITVADTTQDTDFVTGNVQTGGKFILDVDGSAIDADGSLTMGASADSAIYWNGTNLEIDTTTGIDFSISGTTELVMSSTSFSPATTDGSSLGTNTLNWSDLFLDSGAVINFDSGDVTITHSANALAFAGVTGNYTFDDAITPASNDGGSLGVSGTAWSDLFLADGGVVNFGAGGVTATHTSASDSLAFSLDSGNLLASTTFSLAIDGSTVADLTSAGLQLGAANARVTTVLDEDTMVSDSATALATQQSIKAYVDTQLTAEDLDIAADSGTDAIDLDSEILTFASGDGLTSVASSGTSTITYNLDASNTTQTNISTLVEVGALDAGSITANFGAIDNGTSNITTGGILKIDVDGTAENAAGSLTLGAGNDAGIYFDGTDLVLITNGVGASGIVLDAEDDTVEIKGSGVTQATFSTGGLNLVSGDEYSINSTSVLSATTLGSGVVTSSLTTVGALDSGSITANFGNIDIGTSNITTGGIVTLDVDGTGTAAGSLNFGAASDATLFFDGTDFIIRTDGVGASGIVLDSEDDTVVIMGSGVTQATFDTGGLNLVTGDEFSINSTSVLNATTLGSGVVTSSLTTVGALDSGSITSGFGAIDNGTSNITTGGIVTIDVDGTALAAAGSLTMGAGNDAGMFFNGTDLIVRTDGVGASGIILDAEDDTVEIQGSGVTQATFSAGGLNLVSGDEFSINSTSVLNATTLGSGVVTSSLTTVGALDSGSITSNFGAIDNGTSNITTGGILKLDVDGTAENAAGSLTLGAGNDAGIFFDGTDLVIITNGAGASGIILDSEDDTFEFKGSGALLATLSGSGLDLSASDNLSFGGVNVLADSAGTMTLSNVDALDATSEATVASALKDNNFVKTIVSIIVFDDATAMSTGNGAGDVFWRVPSSLNGYDLVEVAAAVQTAGTTGTADIQVHNVTQAVDMLSTVMTIDSGETDTSTALTPAVIDTANDDVATADIIRIDVDAVHTTPANGLLVELTFQLP